MDKLFNFAQGIRLLVGIIPLVILIGVALLGGWTLFNVLRFRNQQKSGERELISRRFDKHGNMVHPRAPGICDECGRAFAEVNFMPGSERMCDECLAALGEPYSHSPTETGSSPPDGGSIIDKPPR